MDLQIEDFLEEYPSVHTHDIQSQIASNYEMQEVETYKKDRILEGSTFFTQQELFQRAAYVAKKMIYVAEAGVGKTGSDICLRTFLKDHDPWTEKAYFITGSTQIDDFKKQVVYGVTAHLYQSSRLREHMSSDKSSKGLTKAINSLVEKNYIVMSYNNFFKELVSVIGASTAEEGNRLLREKYSRSQFFFDEIQFIRITDTSTEDRERFTQYWLLWRLAHVLDGSRIILSSATPHGNKVEEFGHVANVILPLDNQMLIDNAFFKRFQDTHGLEVTYGKDVNWNIKELRKEFDLEDIADYYTDVFVSYLSGMIMYVSAADTGVKLSYIPVEEPGASESLKARIEQFRKIGQSESNKFKRLRILSFDEENGVPGIQMETYMRFKASSEKKSVAQKTQLAILTAVVPESPGLKQNWGTVGFKHWIEPLRNKVDWFRIRKDVLSTEGKSLEYYYREKMASLSPKYVYAIEGMTQCIGKCYAFFDAVFQIGGVYDFGLALEYSGNVTLLEKTRESFTRFDYSPGGSRQSTVKNWSSAKRGTLDRLIKKAPRYAIISGSQTLPEVVNILELYYHPDNMYGEYLKVLLVSKRGQTGINLSSVRRVYSFYVTHSPVDEYQAIMRAVRATSHIDIIPAWKERFGQDFEVEINLMVVIFPEGVKDRSTEDLKIYMRTRERDENRLCINRVLKKLSITGLLTKERNVGKNDYQQECEYLPCQYDFVTDEVLPTKYNNYFALYTDRAMKIEKHLIIDELQKASFLPISEYISKRAGNDKVREVVCYLAIASLCENRDEVYDRFGYLSTITEDSGTLYVTRGNAPVSSFMAEYYSNNLIGVRKRDLLTLNRQKDFKLTKTFFDKLAKLKTREDVSQLVSEYKLETYAIILEKFVKDYLVGSNPSLSESQVMMFKELIELGRDSGNLITVPQPIRALEAVATNNNELPRDFEVLSPLDDQNDIVYVHNVYTTETKRTKSSQAQKERSVEGTLRILMVSEGEWRDCSQYEAVVYRRIFQERITSLEVEISNKFSIYGIITRAHPYLIIKNNEQETTRDAPGSVCYQTPKKVDIFKVMISIGMQDEYVHNMDDTDIMDARITTASYKRKGEDTNYLQRYFRVKAADYYLDVDDYIAKWEDFNQKKIDKKALLTTYISREEKTIASLENGDRITVLDVLEKYKRLIDILFEIKVEQYKAGGAYTTPVKAFITKRVALMKKIVSASKEYIKNPSKYNNYVRIALASEILREYSYGEIRLATDAMAAYAYNILMTNQADMPKTTVCNMITRYMYTHGMLVYKDITEEEVRRMVLI